VVLVTGFSWLDLQGGYSAKHRAEKFEKFNSFARKRVCLKIGAFYK
jgi:hypothetical protein